VRLPEKTHEVFTERRTGSLPSLPALQNLSLSKCLNFISIYGGIMAHFLLSVKKTGWNSVAFCNPKPGGNDVSDRHY